MGSGVSVPTDHEKVTQMLSVLHEDEKEVVEDRVPRQIKEKVARLVVSAMENSADQSRLTMNSDILEHLHELPRILNDLEQNSDPNARRIATEKVRRFLSVEKDPPIQVVIDAGCVPTLVSFLHHDDDHQLQLEAGWALTNIASGNSNQTDVVINAGAVPAFVQLLKSSSSVHVREQSIWALGNIAGDSAARRDMVIAADILNPLIIEFITHTKSRYQDIGNHSSLNNNIETKFCDDDDEKEFLNKMEKFNQSIKDENLRSQGILRNGAWLLSNLCRGRPKVKLTSLKPALPGLAVLIEYVLDEEALSDALWAASYLSDGDQDNIDAVLCADISSANLLSQFSSSSSSLNERDYRRGGSGGGHGHGEGGSLSHRLVELLSHPKESIVTPALRCLGNLVTGDDESTDIVISIHGCLQALRKIINAPTTNKKTKKKNHKKKNENDNHYHGTTPLSPVSAAIKKEACWTLSNMLAGTKSQIGLVMDAGLLSPLISIANLNHKKFNKRALKSKHGSNKKSSSSKSSARVVPLGMPMGFDGFEGDDDCSDYSGSEDEEEDELLKMEELKSLVDGKPHVKESDVHKEAVWALANAASGATKRQVRQLIRGGSVFSLVSALHSEDPGVGAVAADGLTHLLRKAGGGKKGFFFVRGSPAYRWRNRIVKAINTCGGDIALKKLIAKGKRNKGNHNNNNKEESSSSSNSQKSNDELENLMLQSTSDNEYLVEVEKEAAAKAKALLSLLAFTRALLIRAKKEAKYGLRKNKGGGRGGGGGGGIALSDITGSNELFEDDEDDEGFVLNRKTVSILVHNFDISAFFK
mmetsp:Transcript_9948/g.12071  ORF Transcript_9948/g.12071 Transcript_9948/m.12071 type:complete len:814 (+) Transcript_9948:55-2496(+)